MNGKCSYRQPESEHAHSWWPCLGRLYDQAQAKLFQAVVFTVPPVLPRCLLPVSEACPVGIGLGAALDFGRSLLCMGSQNHLDELS